MAQKTPFPPHFKERLKEKYDELKNCYEDLCDEVIYTLKKALQTNDVKIHSMFPRETKIKTFESFFGKVVTKGILQNEFDAIEDIAGVRVICLYRADLRNIENVISESFELLESDTSRTRTEAPFGYSSDHYIVKFGKSCSGPRYDNIKELKCEIQVRTILMDAWATVSHHVDYKQEIDIPKELRTDFNALAGLFYVADTHFEIFKKGVQEARERLTETVQLGEFDLSQEINLDSLQTYMKWKFPERGMKKVESDTVKELKDFGYNHLADLDKNANEAMDVLKELEIKEFGQEKWKPVWAFDGLIRTILDLTDDRYVLRHKKLFKEFKEDERYVKWYTLIKEYRTKLKKT
jgi:putative GTP pyrophosphokinase